MDIQNILAFLPPLLTAMILGAIIGVERNMAGRPAGMRTFALVSMGSALFVTISNSLGNIPGLQTVDALRLTPQILVGIGFIGAGLVFFQDNKISGLTSAAGLWVAAGIGMACGFGMYSLAVIVSILTLAIFSVLWIFEDKYLLKKVHYPPKNDELKK
ncbi:MAG: MgtC/SapB family protein [Minisyncoccia bacterium]